MVIGVVLKRVAGIRFVACITSLRDDLRELVTYAIMLSTSRFASDNHVVIMTLVFLTAVFNGCTQGYDQSMMNNLNLYDTYVDCEVPAIYLC